MARLTELREALLRRSLKIRWSLRPKGPGQQRNMRLQYRSKIDVSKLYDAIAQSDGPTNALWSD
jgi:hypothetical protein